MQSDFLSLLDGAARSSLGHTEEAKRLARMLRRHPDIVAITLTLIDIARADGAKFIRTDWLVAELGMFKGVKIGNKCREGLARLVVLERPELANVIHLRRSARADFIMGEARS